MWTILSALIAPFIWFDTFVQKRFDSVCFYLMRKFGVRKSSIRYTLFTVMIVGLVAGFSQSAIVTKKYAPYAIIGAIWTLLMLDMQRSAAHNDRLAERSPTAKSAEDRLTGSTVMKTWWIISMAMSTCAILGWVPREIFGGLADAGPNVLHPIIMCHLLTTMAGLALEYLRKTPMNPPAEKARESVLAPQPSHAKL